MAVGILFVCNGFAYFFPLFDKDFAGGVQLLFKQFFFILYVGEYCTFWKDFLKEEDIRIIIFFLDLLNLRFGGGFMLPQPPHFHLKR